MSRYVRPPTARNLNPQLILNSPLSAYLVQAEPSRPDAEYIIVPNYKYIDSNDGLQQVPDINDPPDVFCEKIIKIFTIKIDQTVP
ncbi:unnamed protein product [Adineta steineri]|uniref:Uncharacterized protein n=1 Tax=Adineta steineri TaxID=433720 RepID=A0A820C9T5_9BILA|nr:unnamed protein product [Adineta steineri]